MRSRTELVTTTFIDSEEEQTESDDSEEDWRPVSSRNGKKRSSKGRRRNKRKAGSTPKLMAKKKMFEDCGSRDGHGDSDDGDYRNLCLPVTTNMHRSSVDDQKSIGMIKSEEKQSPDKSGVFNLYLYKKDLDQDYKNNSHLCLWRRDGSSLLQKYIRVKTSNCEEFIFTSSSVYSSWDERRRKDFATIDVKCMEDNKRRVTILEPGIIQILSEEMSGRNHVKTETDDKVDGDSSNEMLDSQEEEEEEDEEDEEEEGDYEDDEGEEEVSGDDDDDDDDDDGDDDVANAADVVVDVNSAKTAEEAKRNESYEAVKESKKANDEGTSQPSIA